MSTSDLIEKIERLHATLSRWENGSHFVLQRIGRSEDGTVYDATPDNDRSVWRAEVYENGLDSPAETGEGATPTAAFADLHAKLKAQARERVAAIEATAAEPDAAPVVILCHGCDAPAEGTRPVPSERWRTPSCRACAAGMTFEPFVGVARE